MNTGYKHKRVVKKAEFEMTVIAQHITKRRLSSFLEVNAGQLCYLQSWMSVCFTVTV